MKVKLQDGAPRSKAEAVINVSKNGNTLEVGIDGTVAPVVLEYYEGKVRLRVYGDDPSKPIFVSDLNATPAHATTTAAAAAPVTSKKLPEQFRDHSPAPTAQETVNSVFPPPAETAEPTDDDLAAFDAA